MSFTVEFILSEIIRIKNRNTFIAIALNTTAIETVCVHQCCLVFKFTLKIIYNKVAVLKFNE